MARGEEVFRCCVAWSETVSGTIHRVPVILGNGDRRTAQSSGALPAAVQWYVVFAGRNPQVLGVPWSFETMALGCRFVGSRRSRGHKQSCWISPRLPFLLSFSSHSLSTVELFPCCSLGLKFLGCAEAARFFKHGSASPVPPLHLPQFENLAVPSTAWLGVRETIEVEVSKQTPLYGPGWGRSVMLGTSVEFSLGGKLNWAVTVNSGPGSLRIIFSVPAELATETVSCCRALPTSPSASFSSPTVVIAANGQRQMYGPGPLRLLSGCYFLNMGHAGAFPKRLGLVLKTRNK